MVALLSLVASSLRNQFSGLIVIVFCAAAWMGIQQLGYTEFAMAGRLFLQGGFRRIIDFETRLVEFENTLARATGIEECWVRIRSGSREFGFRGVRMNFEGLVFEDFQRGGFQSYVGITNPAGRYPERELFSRRRGRDQLHRAERFRYRGGTRDAGLHGPLSSRRDGQPFR